MSPNLATVQFNPDILGRARGRSEFFQHVKTFYSTLFFFFFIVDNFKAPKRELEKPFRFCVSDVYKGNLVEIIREYAN